MHESLTTGPGAGMGVERQLEGSQRLAADRGWSVAQEYVDNDLSAYRGKTRPRFEAMLADIEDGQLDAVVAYHQDRLTRTPAEFEKFLATCQAAGFRSSPLSPATPSWGRPTG